MAKKKTETSNTSLIYRPPIVTIMGHVDHGKTTLLDAIRKSRVVDSESGGITQHIGAYQVEHQGQRITFIDTPGHAAFSKMRSRGAEVTDIVILVVAANDGVKPQTVESIKHIKAANVPVIVAINKIDVVGASPDMVKAQLMEYEIFTEGYGGQTPAVPVSALKGEGLSDLLEMILLVAEMEELKADPDASVEATIIETVQDPRQGPHATVIVKNGTLRIGQTVYTGEEAVKIRAMVNDAGQRLDTAVPGMPVEVLGFKQVPEVGAILTGQPGKLIVKKTEVEGEAAETVSQGSINIILKADTKGTLEAIKNNLSSEVTLLDEGVGQIIESDIMHAQTTRAIIIGFHVKPTPAAKKLAQIEKIKLETFDIIYELLDFLEKKVLKLLEPTIDEEILGEARVLATFNMKGNFIIGCRVVSGVIERGQPLHLYREEVLVRDIYIRSIQHGKEEISQAKNGTDCGIALTKSFDVREGDVVKSYKKIETD